MNPCPDPRGHQWSSEDPEATWARFPHVFFRGAEAVMVVCLRPGCPEIGYRIVIQENA